MKFCALSFQSLYIRDGRIANIDINAFAGLPNLTTLHINHCEWKNPPQLNPLKWNLRYLSLNNNNITGFPQDYWHVFMSLERFTVRRNSLACIPLFNALASHLHGLDVSFNRITDLNGRWRENDTVYESLAFLGLTGNNITSVDAEIMKVLPNMALLDLSKNSITHFEDPTQYLVGRSWQYTVDLGENPLDCGSHLAWVVSTREVVGNATCSTPVCVSGIALHEMSKYTRRPTYNTHSCPCFVLMILLS